MNAKIQQEIEKIKTSVKGRGWHLNKTTQKATREIEAMGLSEYLNGLQHPYKGAQIVEEVLDAAKQIGGKKTTTGGWNPGGDGWSDTSISKPSALFLAIREAAWLDFMECN